MLAKRETEKKIENRAEGNIIGLLIRLRSEKKGRRNHGGIYWSIGNCYAVGIWRIV